MSDAPVKSPSRNGSVTLVTQMKPASQSIDSDPTGKPLGKPVSGSEVTLKEPTGKAKDTLKAFNKAVNSAHISYTPRRDSSNAYAGTAYQVLTGKTAPSSRTLPGSDHNLKPQIPMCAGNPSVCGG